MEIIDNINHLLGDDLKTILKPDSKLKIAASCFSIYAFEALKKELNKIESLEFIFTSPTFLPDEVTDKFKKERREFHIPKAERERSFYGSDFEIQLKNKLTQKVPIGCVGKRFFALIVAKRRCNNLPAYKIKTRQLFTCRYMDLPLLI